MERALLERHRVMLHRLSQLPRFIVHADGRANVSEFVLHELCAPSCFDLSKAAYFVDNRDFKHLHGVAGFDRHDAYPHGPIWDNPDTFTQHMSDAAFNSRVRSVMRDAGTVDVVDRKLLDDLAHKLDFTTWHECSWNMRHSNTGLLMYTKANPTDATIDNHIADGLSLLSFCPVF